MKSQLTLATANVVSKYGIWIGVGVRGANVVVQIAFPGQGVIIVSIARSSIRTVLHTLVVACDAILNSYSRGPIAAVGSVSAVYLELVSIDTWNC